MANTLNQRKETENLELIYDYPLITYNSPLALNQPLTGAGLNQIDSFKRFVFPAQATPVGTYYPNYTGGTEDRTKWYRVLQPIFGPYTTQNNIALLEGGLYFINFMSSYTISPGNNSEYYTELIYYPSGVPPPGTIVASANCSKATAGTPNPVVQGCFFRYFNTGDEITVRTWNSEVNSMTQTLSIIRIPSVTA